METVKITSAAAALPRPLAKLTAGLLVKAAGGFSATKENLKRKFLGFADGSSAMPQWPICTAWRKQART